MIPALVPALGGAPTSSAGAPTSMGGGGAGVGLGGAGGGCGQCAFPNQVCLQNACVAADTSPLLATGVASTCDLLADGRLYCWGRNARGELGVGDQTDRRSPVRSAVDLEFRQVSGFGGESYCGVALNSSLWCWGNNLHGVLGLGDAANRALPGQVGDDLDWGLSFMASGHACARRLSDASWWCWGRNVDGELGLGSNEDQLSPARLPDSVTFALLTLGWGHTCALSEEGALWCWGRNAENQLGLGDNVQRTVPQPLDAGSDWTRVSAGAKHTCALRSDQSLWCWGENANGQLGVGDIARRAEPTVVPGGPWLEVAAGVWSTCVIDQQRGLHCFGQVAGNAQSPRRIGDIADAANVSVGSRHACALRGSGALWCWGQNGNGQLGQGDTVTRDQPVEVQLSGG